MISSTLVKITFVPAPFAAVQAGPAGPVAQVGPLAQVGPVAQVGPAGPVAQVAAIGQAVLQSPRIQSIFRFT